MPLTVQNILRITGSSKQIGMLHRNIIKAGMRYSLLELLFPNRQNVWGTKYPDHHHSDITICTFEDQQRLGEFASTLQLSFQTDETAPVSAFKLLAQKHPDMDICLDYRSTDFYGIAHYDGDWEAVQHVVYEQEPTTYAAAFADEVADDDVTTVIGLLLRRFQIRSGLTEFMVSPTTDGFSAMGRLGFHGKLLAEHSDTLQGAINKLWQSLNTQEEDEE